MSEFEMSELKPKKTIKFNEESISIQKNCNPGPNVKFEKGDLPFSAFIINYDKEGSLGCGDGKYPQYKDGKYCCYDNKFTEQELLDYVNFLLEGAMTNVSETAFLKYLKPIEFLMNTRKNILENNPGLNDNLEVPEGYEGTPSNYLNNWYGKIFLDAKRISTYRPDPVGGRTRKRRSKRIQKNQKSKKHIKKNKKSKKTHQKK